MMKTNTVKNCDNCASHTHSEFGGACASIERAESINKNKIFLSGIREHKLSINVPEKKICKYWRSV